jgi:chemotaxis protein MotB
MTRIRNALQGRPGVQVQGDRIVLATGVLFGTGSADLGPVGRDSLARVGEALRETVAQLGNTRWVLQIEGHTDRRRPARATNWELSSLRAVSVLRFLEGRGVPSERLAAVGLGEHQPIDRGDSEEAFARNRRIELRFVTR